MRRPWSAVGRWRKGKTRWLSFWTLQLLCKIQWRG